MLENDINHIRFLLYKSYQEQNDIQLFNNKFGD